MTTASPHPPTELRKPPSARWYPEDELFERFDRIANEVEVERVRQNVKFRNERTTSGCHTVMEWGNILGEEYLEVQREINDAWWPCKEANARDVAVAKLRTELVQLAALCFAVIERIDDNDPMLTYKGN